MNSIPLLIIARNWKSHPRACPRFIDCWAWNPQLMPYVHADWR